MALPPTLDDENLFKFRTKICERYVKQGRCDFADKCQYSHDLRWTRRPPWKYTYSPELCADMEFRKDTRGRTIVKSNCQKHRNCRFSHTKEEQMYHPKIYKTLCCNQFMKDGWCERYYCPFAHGETELRPGDLFYASNKVLKNIDDQDSLCPDIYLPSDKPHPKLRTKFMAIMGGQGVLPQGSGVSGIENNTLSSSPSAIESKSTAQQRNFTNSQWKNFHSNAPYLEFISSHTPTSVRSDTNSSEKYGNNWEESNCANEAAVCTDTEDFLLVQGRKIGNTIVTTSGVAGAQKMYTRNNANEEAHGNNNNTGMNVSLNQKKNRKILSNSTNDNSQLNFLPSIVSSIQQKHSTAYRNNNFSLATQNLLLQNAHTTNNNMKSVSSIVCNQSPLATSSPPFQNTTNGSGISLSEQQHDYISSSTGIVQQNHNHPSLSSIKTHFPLTNALPIQQNYLGIPSFSNTNFNLLSSKLPPPPPPPPSSTNSIKKGNNQHYSNVLYTNNANSNIITLATTPQYQVKGNILSSNNNNYSTPQPPPPNNNCNNSSIMVQQSSQQQQQRGGVNITNNKEISLQKHSQQRSSSFPTNLNYSMMMMQQQQQQHGGVNNNNNNQTTVTNNLQNKLFSNTSAAISNNNILKSNNNNVSHTNSTTTTSISSLKCPSAGLTATGGIRPTSALSFSSVSANVIQLTPFIEYLSLPIGSCRDDPSILVYMGVYTHQDGKREAVVVKEIPVILPKKMSYILNELEKFINLDASHLVNIKYLQLLPADVGDGCTLWLVLDKCEGAFDDIVHISELSEKSLKGSIPPAGMIEVLDHIVLGVHTLHSMGVAHMRIHPWNIMLEEQFNIKVGDIAGKLRYMTLFSLLYAGLQGTCKAKLLLKMILDNPSELIWMAPEIIRGFSTLYNSMNDLIDKCVLLNDKRKQKELFANLADNSKWSIDTLQKADVWSTGAVLFYIVSGGRHPFGCLSNSTEVLENIINNNPINIHLIEGSPLVCNLLRSMLDVNPCTRISLLQSICHPLYWKFSDSERFLKAVLSLMESPMVNSTKIIEQAEFAAQLSDRTHWVNTLRQIQGMPYIETLLNGYLRNPNCSRVFRDGCIHQTMLGILLFLAKYATDETQPQHERRMNVTRLLLFQPEVLLRSVQAFLYPRIKKDSFTCKVLGIEKNRLENIDLYSPLEKKSNCFTGNNSSSFHSSTTNYCENGQNDANNTRINKTNTVEYYNNNGNNDTVNDLIRENFSSSLSSYNNNTLQQNSLNTNASLVKNQNSSKIAPRQNHIENTVDNNHKESSKNRINKNEDFISSNVVCSVEKEKKYPSTSETNDIKIESQKTKTEEVETKEKTTSISNSTSTAILKEEKICKTNTNMMILQVNENLFNSDEKTEKKDTFSADKNEEENECVKATQKDGSDSEKQQYREKKILNENKLIKQEKVEIEYHSKFQQDEINHNQLEQDIAKKSQSKQDKIDEIVSSKEDNIEETNLQKKLEIQEKRNEICEENTAEEEDNALIGCSYKQTKLVQKFSEDIASVEVLESNGVLSKLQEKENVEILLNEDEKENKNEVFKQQINRKESNEVEKNVTSLSIVNSMTEKKIKESAVDSEKEEECSPEQKNELKVAIESAQGKITNENDSNINKIAGIGSCITQ